MAQWEDAQSTAGSHSCLPTSSSAISALAVPSCAVLRGCEEQGRQPVPMLSLPSVAIITLTHTMLPEIATLSVSQNLLLLN